MPRTFRLLASLLKPGREEGADGAFYLTSYGGSRILHLYNVKTPIWIWPGGRIFRLTREISLLLEGKAT
jgi:hypothetical protein